MAVGLGPEYNVHSKNHAILSIQALGLGVILIIPITQKDGKFTVIVNVMMENVVGQDITGYYKKRCVKRSCVDPFAKYRA